MLTKRLCKRLIGLGLVAWWATGAQAAVEFELQQSGNIIRVQAVSSENYHAPLNRTASAQVTLRVPAGTSLENTATGETGRVTSVHGDWQLNSRSDRPVENPAFDYLSIGLTELGTTGIPYQADVPVTLFEFEVSNCRGVIRLLDNDSDAFNKMPNSANSNPGNQIAVLGEGGDNAWRKGAANQQVRCRP